MGRPLPPRPGHPGMPLRAGVAATLEGQPSYRLPGVQVPVPGLQTWKLAWVPSTVTTR
jgi:hypothetical protein